MSSSLLHTVLSQSFSTPHQTVYVIPDSQMIEIKHSQKQKELNKIEISRQKLVENYKTQVRGLDKRKHELKEEIRALSKEKD